MTLKIDIENQILALFDDYFWPFNKFHKKSNTFLWSVQSYRQSEMFWSNSVEMMKNLWYGPTLHCRALAIHNLWTIDHGRKCKKLLRYAGKLVGSKKHFLRLLQSSYFFLHYEKKHTKTLDQLIFCKYTIVFGKFLSPKRRKTLRSY